MNMTREQMEAGFFHQCEMYSGLGAQRQREIVEAVRIKAIEKRAHAAETAEPELGHKSARRTSRRK